MKLRLSTSFPVDYGCWDFKLPAGAVNDNTKNRKFNDKLYKLFRHKPLYVVDIGCAGGGFVKDCVDDGHVAVGLEGTDLCKRDALHEWGKIPNNLFTCDCRKPFSLSVQYDGNADWLSFNADVVTCWETFEHFVKEDVPLVLDNVKRLMKKPNSLFIGSIALFHSNPHHLTVETRLWWEDRFRQYGFQLEPILEEYFSPNGWLVPNTLQERYYFVVSRKDA